MKHPLETVRRIGDKLIRETPFEYCLTVAPTVSTFDRMHSVDFGRTFGLGRPAVAYASTNLRAPRPMELTVETEHNDGCRVWLNGELVYMADGDRDIRLRIEERSRLMSRSFVLRLREGDNHLLVKSETRGHEWTFFLQPPATHGAVMPDDFVCPEIGLIGVPRIDAAVAALSNWLVMGPFPNPAADGARGGLDLDHAPECGMSFGRMVPGLDGPVTWTIPKTEILGEMIDRRPWGTNYCWNYHNGGVAWAMQALSEVTGEPRYRHFAARFCDFHLDGIPFVEHQVKTLHRIDSANHFIIDTPLLDFTLAPSLPFLGRLLAEGDFPGRQRYVEWIDNMICYAVERQVRLPGSAIFTRTTPVEFTTWVDDMFMGIPFLVWASLWVTDPAAKQRLLDDAARQIAGFGAQVWDDEAQLYMHARYYGNPAKLPYWARCNGWAAWAMSEVLAHLPDSHPEAPAIRMQFERHCDSLLRFQHACGLWPNVLDHPESPLEVSGSAIFVMAMARGLRHGWLNEERFRPAVLRGWEGIESRIDEDGTVHDICMGTMCTEDVGYYLKRPFFKDDTHGLFAVLFAGIEVGRLLGGASEFTDAKGTASRRSAALV